MNYSEVGISLDGKNNEITSNGSLRVKNVAIMKEGVLNYNPPNGEAYKTYISGKALNNLVNSDEAKSKPAVMVHNGLLDVEDKHSYKEKKVGHLESVSYDNKEGVLYADLLIDDGDAIKAIQDKKQIRSSAGYNWKPLGPGTSEDGQDYDYAVSNIVFNHLAIQTPNPRMGEKGITHLDNEDKMTIKAKVNKFSAPGVSFDGFEVEYNKESEKAVETLMEQNQDLKDALTISLDDADKQSGTLKAKEEELKKLKEDQKGMMSMDDMNAKIDEIKKTEAEFAKVCGVAKTYGIEPKEGESVIDVQKAVLGKVHKNLSLDDMSEGQIQGAYITIESNPDHSQEKALSDAILSKGKEQKQTGGLSFDGMSPEEILEATEIN